MDTKGIVYRLRAEVLFDGEDGTEGQGGFTGGNKGNGAEGQGGFNHEWTLKASSTDYALKFFLMKRAGLRGRGGGTGGNRGNGEEVAGGRGGFLQKGTEVTERRGIRLRR